MSLAVRGDGGDLPIFLLSRQPYLDVVAFPGREADISTAQEHGAVGQVQRFQNCLRVLDHALVLLLAGLSLDDLYELYFVELVLAKKSASITSV